MVFRMGLLATLSLILKIDVTLFGLLEKKIPAKSLVLILGGIFLLYKVAKEIYCKKESNQNHYQIDSKKNIFSLILFQIILWDLVFFINSIHIDARMLKEHLVKYIVVILFTFKPIREFILEYPFFKIDFIQMQVIPRVTFEFN